MRSSALSIAGRFGVVALTFGLIGAVHAADARNLPSASADAQNSQQATDAIEAPADWNVDYPSQLGPEGPRVVTTAATRNGASPARPQASR